MRLSCDDYTDQESLDIVTNKRNRIINMEDHTSKFNSSIARTELRPIEADA